MFIAQQVMILCLFHHLGQEDGGHIRFQQTVSILGEHRDIPPWLVQVHAHEPSEQDAIVDLLHQQPL